MQLEVGVREILNVEEEDTRDTRAPTTGTAMMPNDIEWTDARLLCHRGMDTSDTRAPTGGHIAFLSEKDSFFEYFPCIIDSIISNEFTQL